MSDSDEASNAGALATSSGVSPTGKRAPRKAAAQKVILPAGFVLNGIYEVKRFLARGGMGEVYEGVNVNADERVAIKVILPHLATDPKVQALFRKEAKTLTSFAHPALVQYRVLAREPRKDLLYIVTDFIDGEPLTNLIGRVKPTTGELVMLTRRLAQGLHAAHSHGAIHRDMSPDNVLLPGGVLSQAKIIDFGIAKSMEIGAQTVVGDGFAGKLGYVAPEQFGDFDRRIGPWTDIYSLALVVLALAGGAPPDMGTTLVEAVDRRRAGPLLRVLPELLQPLFGRMLAANPNARPQSMTDVIAALDALDVPFEEPTALTRGSPTPQSDTPHGGGPPDTRTVIGPAAGASSWSTAPTSEPAAPTSAWGDGPKEPREASFPPGSPGPVGHDPRTVFAPAGSMRPMQPPPTAPVEAPTPTPAPIADPLVPPASAAPASRAKAEGPKPAPKAARPKPLASPDDSAHGTPAKGPPWALIGGGVAAVLVAALAFLFWPKSSGPQLAGAAPAATSAGAISPGAAKVEDAVAAALPGISCSWLLVDHASAADGSPQIRVSGTAADAVMVQQAVVRAAQGAGTTAAQIDTSQVVVAPAAMCPMLDTVRAFHAPRTAGVPTLVAQQPQFEIGRGIQGCPAGLWAQPMVNLTPEADKSFALVELQASGRLQQIAASREQFLSLVAKVPDKFKDLGGGRYRVSTCQGEQGLAGVLMIQGAGPFDLGLRTGAPVNPPANFADNLRKQAQAHGWTMQMALFRLVDNQPNLPESAVASVAAAAPVAAPAASQAAAALPVAGSAAGAAASTAPPAAPAAPAPPTTVAVNGKAPADWSACRRFANGAWEELGYASQAQCVQRIFTDHCEAQTGQSGEVSLRRYNGFVQAKSGKLFVKWTNLAPAAECTK